MFTISLVGHFKSPSITLCLSLQGTPVFEDTAGMTLSHRQWLSFTTFDKDFSGLKSHLQGHVTEENVNLPLSSLFKPLITPGEGCTKENSNPYLPSGLDLLSSPSDAVHLCSRLTHNLSKLLTACLCLPSAGIKGVCHH